MSAEQRENLEAVLRQSAFPVGSDVSEQRRLLRELISAQPLPADVTVTAAALGPVRTAEITSHRRCRGHSRYHPGGAACLPNFYPVLDEAGAALDRAGQFLSAHLADAERVTA